MARCGAPRPFINVRTPGAARNRGKAGDEDGRGPGSACADDEGAGRDAPAPTEGER